MASSAAAAPATTQVRARLITVVAGDWQEEETADLDAVGMASACVAKAGERIESIILQPEGRKGLSYLFCKKRSAVPKSALYSLAVLCHSRPLPDDYKTRKGHSRCCLSFASEGNYLEAVPFEMVAKEILGSTRKDRKYDIIILSCCQGHRLAGLLRPALEDTGIVVFFGADGEEALDGVSAYLAQDLMEKMYERIADCVMENAEPDPKGEETEEADGEGKGGGGGAPPDPAAIFRHVYTTLGEDYVGPAGDRHAKRACGQYIFAEYFLDRSLQQAEMLPTYTREFTFAGNLRAFNRNGDELVTDDLKAARAEHMARTQREADLCACAGKERDGASDAGPAAKRLRV